MNDLANRKNILQLVVYLINDTLEYTKIVLKFLYATLFQ